MKILKADIFSENGLLLNPFQETTNDFFIILNGFVHKIDQKLHIYIYIYTEIPINWSLNYFVE